MLLPSRVEEFCYQTSIVNWFYKIDRISNIQLELSTKFQWATLENNEPNSSGTQRIPLSSTVRQYNNQQQATLIKGVAERGKETNTHFFFLRIWLFPPLPTKYSMFSEFQCFFWMFFSHINLFFLDSCADHFQLPDHQFTRFKSRSKIFCVWFFGRRNICGKLLKAASFVNSTVTSDIISGIGADRV